MTKLRNTIIVGLVTGISATIPMLYSTNPEIVRSWLSSDKPSQPAEVMLSGLSLPMAAKPGPGRRVEIEADARGHFIGEFKINGRRIDALIDTGATAVAVNLSTARKLGLQIQPSDMKNTVNTANGQAKATVVQIERIEIGRISVDNVPTLVLEDDALGSVLVGMTFLNKLKSFGADGKVMRLVQ